MRKGLQHAIHFHVDDLKSSHKNPKVNDQFEKWLQGKCGGCGKAKAHQGKAHDHLGMQFDCRKKGKVKIDMPNCVQDMLDEFPVKFEKTQTAKSPADNTLFSKGNGKKPTATQSEKCHTVVAKGLFISKHARPDVHPTIAVLCA